MLQIQCMNCCAFPVSCSSSSLTGEPLSADQDPGRLLLLCVWAAGGQGRPRPLLCGDGPGHDRGHLVSYCTGGARSTGVVVEAVLSTCPAQ